MRITQALPIVIILAACGDASNTPPPPMYLPAMVPVPCNTKYVANSEYRSVVMGSANALYVQCAGDISSDPEVTWYHPNKCPPNSTPAYLFYAQPENNVSVKIVPAMVGYIVYPPTKTQLLYFNGNTAKFDLGAICVM